MLDMSIKKFLYTFIKKLGNPKFNFITGNSFIPFVHGPRRFCDTKGGGNFFLGTIPTQFAKDHSRGFLLDHAVTSFLYFAHYLCSSDYHYTLFVLKVKRFHAQNVHK
nr:MAG TPA: hypothetical protein [Caudoviricetes sp.]